MLTNIFCLLSRIVKSHWYWCCINSWYVDIEPILVTNKWVIRLSCKPPKHQFQMVPPPVNSVPDVELWYWEDIPAQCQAPATLTADRAEPRPAPDWHAENGPAGYWLQPPLALSWSLCLIATIKILHVVLLFASPLALRKARDSTSGWQLMALTYFGQVILLHRLFY